MKEIYDWVPWFRELAQNIAEGTEEDLNQKANDVNWGENLAPLHTGDKGIDPFSFFYFLASKAATRQLETVYKSVSHIFAVRSPLPNPSADDYYIFPTPEARYRVFYEMSDPGHELLWRLFNDAVEDEPTIAQTEFEDALKLSGVGVTRLTQTLFLINPEYYQPVDNITDGLSGALGLPAPSAIEAEIKKAGGYEKYRAFLNRLTEAFPGCQPYELNMLFYLLKTKLKSRIELTDQFYQISTYVFDPGGGDYWDDFEKNNWVYTGGPGSGKSWDEKGNYPLTEPARGDIILVRTGRQRGRAIGIVYKNDYAESAITENNRIHVLWISKADESLSSFTAMQGLSKAGAPTLQAFESSESYKNSIGLIRKLNSDSTEIEPYDDEDAMEPGKESTKQQYPLNQILYGPPGTSKTWHTVNHALAIIDGKQTVDPLVKESKEVRDAKMRRFKQLKASGQIEMVTFHQNYNYEDFIEGIRPVLDNVGSGNVEYKLVPGVFKRVAKRAAENQRETEQANGESWDIDALLEAFAAWIEKRLQSEGQIKLFPPDRKHGAKFLTINRSQNGMFESVTAGRETDRTPRRLRKDMIEKYYDAFYYRKIESEAAIKPERKSQKKQHSSAHYYFALFEKIRDFHDNVWRPEEPSTQKQNHVLIIDEINRGNIAKIFGELITLIEESKRIGGHDETTATLPYSKEEFGVPDNLYIIGTMNTADRSIALLDTALRRRFDFVEMMPDPELVPEDVGDVDCRELLNAMNERIRFLLDREHQIGHTYLMNVKNMDSLATTFKNKIVPLLQEYFYDNWEKIDLVLNRNGFIKEREVPENLRGEQHLIDEEKKIYELLPADNSRWSDPASYQSIYGGKPSPQEDIAETEPGS